MIEMNVFCPFCANLLIAQKGLDGYFQYVCLSCPYIHRITRETSWLIKTESKRTEGVFSDEATWSGAQKTETTVCPKCSHNVASFIEIQTRSADEPMTVFYNCSQCKAIWKD